MNKENGSMPGWYQVAWQADSSHCKLDRAGHTATAVGSSVYIALGGNGGNFYSDVLVFNTKSGRLSQPIAKLPPGVKPRSNHTATLIGRRIWLIAGNDVDDVFGDVIALDTASNTWQSVQVSDPHKLLQRTAHAAEVHPRYPHNILLMGGYGPMEDSCLGDYDMHCDLIMLDTQNCSTERLAAFHGCVPPTPRAWHTMNAIGDRLYIFGGRNTAGIVGNDDSSLLVVYDVIANHWLRPPVSGKAPSPRSSHRTVVMGNRIILYGGASAGDDTRMKERMNDVHSLVVQPNGQLVWSTCDTPQQAVVVPQARSAHTMTLVETTAYVICGYNGSKNTSDKHACDCWALGLRPDAFERANLAAAGAAAGQQPAAGSGRSKRGTAAVVAAGAPPNGSTAAAAAALAAGMSLTDADANLGSDWRQVKRQRSGGIGNNGRQQQQPQPIMQQQHQGLMQQQQGLHAPPGHDPAMSAAYAAAAVAAVGQVMSVPGSRSPLRHGSPLQDSFGLNFLQQQEYDGLRQQLQDRQTRITSLETELRLLQQQLSEAKADQRQDKQLAEQRLQESLVHRDEAARQRAQVEQMLVRQQRAQEEATVAQQDLSAAKEKLQRAEVERDSVQQQLQALHVEVRKQRKQQAETDKELQQVRLQLQQHEQGERRLQEQLARAQQQHQDDESQTRAATEQHQKELQRVNETLAEERRQHAAAVQQYKQQETAQAQQLQEKAQLVQELQKQLDAAQAGAADARKQRDDAVQVQVTTRDQLSALNTSHKTVLQEKEQLAGEVAKLRDEAERCRSELEHHRAAGRAVQGAFAQLQAAMTTMSAAAAGMPH